MHIRHELIYAEKIYKMLSTDNIKDIYPMSPMQAGMYFSSLYNRSSNAYFEQISYAVKGNVNVEIFEKSLEFLFETYENLRTVFNHNKMDEPLQVVLKKVPTLVSFSDLTNNQKRNDVIAQYQLEDMLKGFDLNKDVLMRIKIFKMLPDTFTVIWSYHHILMDGWSAGMFLDEFNQVYHQILSGSAPKVPQRSQYKVYIDWLAKRDIALSLNFWEDYLKDYDTLTSFPQKKLNNSSYLLREKVVKLDEHISELLTSYAFQSGFTLSNVLQAIWGILLSKYNHSQDAIFGLVVSGRPEEIPGIDSMLGLFINTIPVRVRCSEDYYVKDIIKSVSLDNTETMPHRYCQLADVQNVSEINNNLLDHILVFDNYPVENYMSNSLQGDHSDDVLTVSNVTAFEQTNYDLTVLVNLTVPISFKFKYNASIYNETVIKLIWANLHSLLKEITHNKQLKVSDISLLQSESFNKLVNISYEESRLNLLGAFNKKVIPFDSRVYIFDDQFRLLPEGIVGEIYLSGVWSDFKAENLLPDPFRKGFYMLDTGYRGSWNYEREIDKIHHKNEEVLINGITIVKSEIEHFFLSLDKVTEAKIVYEQKNGEGHLILFYNGKLLESSYLENIVIPGIIEDLSVEFYHMTTIMPRSSNGLIDENALTMMRESGLEAREAYEPSLIEIEILKIWKEVLQRDEISVYDNFFKVSGNSIKATQIVSRMYKAGLKVSLKSIFTYPTIRELAGLLSLTVDNSELQLK